jgi:nitrogen fixation NifU-like protein
MDHFMNPRNVGEIESPDGVGEVGNPACGDMMRLYLKIEEGRVRDAKFRTFGCGAAIASSSMLTEMIKGKTVDEARAITNQQVAEALDGLPAVKIHCSVMAEQAVKSALDDYIKKHAG